MKILVAGSTGLIGEALVESLSQKGHQVFRLLRLGKLNNENENENSENLLWDPPSKGLELQQEKFDAVINLCGEPVAGKRWKPEQKHKLYQSRIVTTRLLVSAISKMNPSPKIFLNASAIGIYGAKGDTLLTENSARNLIHKSVKQKSNNFMMNLCEDWEEVAEIATQAKSKHLHSGLV